MRILLAEDERSLARAIVALLEKNNYSADAVYDGEEALEYLAAGNYDAAILEDNLKRMGLNLTWLDKQLEQRHIHSAEEVFLALCDRKGKLLLYEKEGGKD